MSDGTRTAAHSPEDALRAVGTLLGRTGTASWLPARTDPASTSTTN
ncbi:hypothetical protein [Streptomyces sp. VNUA24]|nr:hypothetical protein [Streptomyces sp. VNUA24]WEH16340.1 hypothetical protein PYR72_22525 [Streptomyces sp. VNUA24]